MKRKCFGDGGKCYAGEGRSDKITFLPAVLLAAVLLCLALVGCGSKSESKQQNSDSKSSQSSQGSEKPPQELSEIERSIDRVFVLLNGPKGQAGTKTSGSQSGTDKEESSKKESGEAEQSSKSNATQEQKDQGNSNKGKSAEQSGENGPQAGGSSENQSQKKEPTTNAQSTQEKTDQQDVWQTVSQEIKDLHFNWNAFMPLAVKKSGGRDLTEKFSNALNSLSNASATKNRMSTLMAANNLYDDIPAFYRIYQPKSVWSYKKLRYFTRDLMLNAMNGNWDYADKGMGSIKSSWEVFKNDISKEEKETGDKLNFSISELEKVIKERNLDLTQVKGEIVLTNIREMEKLEEKKETAGTKEQGG